MSTANATVTGINGPGVALTSQSFPNVSTISFNIASNTIMIDWTPTGKNTTQRSFIQYSNIATVTYTISSGVATITISS